MPQGTLMGPQFSPCDPLKALILPQDSLRTLVLAQEPPLDPAPAAGTLLGLQAWPVGPWTCLEGPSEVLILPQRTLVLSPGPSPGPWSCPRDLRRIPVLPQGPSWDPNSSPWTPSGP